MHTVSVRHLGGVWYIHSNTYFQFLNNITRIFLHFFIHTYFYTCFQTTKLSNIPLTHISNKTTFSKKVNKTRQTEREEEEEEKESQPILGSLCRASIREGKGFDWCAEGVVLCECHGQYYR